MAQTNDIEPKLLPEKRESNEVPKKDSKTSDVVPDNRKHQYFKGKTYRKKKGKTTKPSVKTLKETDVKETVNCIEETSMVSQNNNEVVRDIPTESRSDACNGVKEDCTLVSCDCLPPTRCIPFPSTTTLKPEVNSKLEEVESCGEKDYTVVKCDCLPPMRWKPFRATTTLKPEVIRKQEKVEAFGEKDDTDVTRDCPPPLRGKQFPSKTNLKPQSNRKPEKPESYIEEIREDLTKVMSDINFYDPDAIFNALTFEEKILLFTNYIEVPKKRSEKHPTAKFHCNICKFHCPSVTYCRSHIKGQSHIFELKERKLLDSMRRVPLPTRGQIEAIDKMVLDIVETHGMVESERIVSIEVADEVSTFVADNFPGCSLMLYGSVASRLALKESNIDMNLRAPPNLNGPTTLGAISKLISENPLFRDITNDFDEGRPSVHFVHKRTNVKCSICLCKEETMKTTEIISKYQTIDPRVRQLAVIFRKWAKSCQIDNHKNGMWPPHTFQILLIYYLQQCNPPVLPVLHELIGDPEDDTYLEPSELIGRWKQLNTMSVGELWLGLLRFYAVEYQHSERVVCIRKKAPLKRSVKNWIGKRTAIEDPSCVKRNVSRTIIHNNSFRYIMNCFRLTFMNYAIPRCDETSLYAYIQTPLPKLEKDPEYIKRNLETSKYWRSKFKNSKFFSMDSSSGDKEENDIRSSSEAYCPEKPSDKLYIVAEELSEADANFFSSRLKKEFILYLFCAVTGNKDPPIICTICTMDGHTKEVCPDARLPPLPDLPPMTEQFCAQLDAFCHYVFEKHCHRPEDLRIRNDILEELEDFIRGFYPDVQLSLFGSSANGFGFRNSDLDICLTFKSNPSGQDIDVTKLITKLVMKLKKMPSIKNILPIPSAKVPIIKFTHMYSQLEGDISLYNTLAQHNTQLLKAYSCIDERAKILGFVMKKFAKLCGICDASRGSLSSYAYILMVIYFLQQCDPPVLPVLQEVCDEEQKPVCLQEGQDVWFFKDLDRLKEVWPDYGKNNLSVGALWLQLLRFYTEDFDFEEYVISIRRKQRIYKFEKMWYKKAMAIEDPFDINHNLGGALSRKMKLFIIKSLRKGRYHFGNPRNKLPPNVRSWEDYFLNDASLREGAPPNNGCHICKKIGHKVRNCPERVNYQREKRQLDAEHGKNAQGFAGQHQDQRRRMQQGSFHNNYWAKGTALVKDDSKHIPAFTQQQIRPMWYQPQWYPYQRPGAPMMPWYSGGMQPNSRTPEMPPSQMKPPNVLPPHDSNMSKVEMPPRNHLFRSVEQGQNFHDPRIPLSNYRKQSNYEESLKNHPGDPQGIGGAIPKVAQMYHPRPRYGKIKGAKNDNRQKP